MEEDIQSIFDNPEKKILQLEKEMKKAAENLNFEEAIRLREEIKKIQNKELGLKKT